MQPCHRLGMHLKGLFHDLGRPPPPPTSETAPCGEFPTRQDLGGGLTPRIPSETWRSSTGRLKGADGRPGGGIHVLWDVSTRHTAPRGGEHSTDTPTPGYWSANPCLHLGL